jgi:hypothetical protein
MRSATIKFEHDAAPLASRLVQATVPATSNSTVGELLPASVKN